MLCGLPTMQQASVCDGLSFDPFPFDEDRLAASEVDVGRCQIAEALVVAQVIVVGDEVSDPGLEFTRQYLARGWTVIATHRRSELPPTLADLSAKYKTLRIERVDGGPEGTADASPDVRSDAAVNP